MDDIDQRLRRIEAEAAIVRLKSQYARFADDGYSPDGLAGLFTEDGVWDGGDLLRHRPRRECHPPALRAAAPARIPWALHYVLNPVIDVSEDGNSATGSWYLWQPCVRQRSSGLVTAWLAGTYADEYELTIEGWRFRRVEVRAQWLEQPPALQR